jgi:hypothetical protein
MADVKPFRLKVQQQAQLIPEEPKPEPEPESEDALDAKKQCVNQFSVALEVIDNIEKLEEKAREVAEVNDISNLRTEYLRISKEVLKNIVPKTMPLPLRTSFEQFGLNRWGIARRHRYNDRYESKDMMTLISGTKDGLSYIEDDDEMGRYSDKNSALPKKYKDMPLAEIYLDLAIEHLKKSKFRTRKRSVERMERLRDFTVKYRDLLKRKEDAITIEVGQIFIWNGDCRSYWQSRNRTGEEVGFISEDFMLEYSGGYNGLRLKNECGDEFSLHSCSRKLDSAFAFANLYAKFDKWIAKIMKVKQERNEKVDEAITEMRSTFAKELLVAKAKQITG